MLKSLFQKKRGAIISRYFKATHFLLLKVEICTFFIPPKKAQKNEKLRDDKKHKNTSLLNILHVSIHDLLFLKRKCLLCIKKFISLLRRINDF